LAIEGDTIKLQVEFYDWNGNLATPTSTTLRIYNIRKAEILETTPTLVGTGKYEYEYTIPKLPGNMFYYEFSGILEGKPITSRKEYNNIWAK
jgi:hypothetical protein